MPKKLVASLGVLTSLVFASVIGISHARASSSQECRLLLTQFLKDRSTERNTWSEEMQTQLDTAAQMQGVDSVPYSDMAKLIPLFNSGIVHKAIAQEFAKKNHKSEKEITRAMAAFPYLKESEQIDFVDDVVVRLLYTVTDSVSLTGSQLAKVEKEALGYHMDLDTYFQFVQAWKTQRASNYIIIKIAILENLLSKNGNFSQSVRDLGSTWFNRNKLGDDKNLVLPPTRTEASFADLIIPSNFSKWLAKSPFAGGELKVFFKTAPLVGSGYFLESNFQYLTLGQLKELVTSDGTYNPVFLALAPELQSRIEKREQLLTEVSKESQSTVLKLQEVEQSLEGADRDATSLKGLFDSASSGKSGIKKINHDEFLVIQTMLSQTESKGISVYLEEIRTVLKKYLRNLNSAQVRTLFNGALKFGIRYNSATQLLEVFETFYNSTRQFDLEMEDTSIIKGLIKDKIVTWSQASEIQKGLNLMQSDWGTGNSGPVATLTLNEVEGKLAAAVSRRDELIVQKTALSDELKKFKLKIEAQLGAQTP